jgi:hypothetical protein
MYLFLVTGLEDRNTNRPPGSQGVLQENECIHPELLYLLYLLHNDMWPMAARGNRLNNVFGHLFQRVDATSVGHLLPKTDGLQTEEDVPAGDSV